MLAIATLLFGALVMVGGWIGYSKAGSLPSLLMGSLFGLLLVASAIPLFGEGAKWSRIIAFFTTALLFAFFAHRLFTTGKMVPSGIMVLLALGWFLLFFIDYQR